MLNGGKRCAPPPRHSSRWLVAPGNGPVATPDSPRAAANGSRSDQMPQPARAHCLGVSWVGPHPQPPRHDGEIEQIRVSIALRLVEIGLASVLADEPVEIDTIHSQMQVVPRRPVGACDIAHIFARANSSILSRQSQFAPGHPCTHPHPGSRMSLMWALLRES